MKRYLSYCVFVLLIGLSFGVLSCKKDSALTTGHLDFSKDTIVFDTVFTTIGSTTQQFKIYNNNDRTIKIDEIELMGGDDSPFRINIDGEAATLISEVLIEEGDSLFGFVEVTLDVNGGTLPLVVEDSLRFRTNGKDQYIHLVVWGQDAYFHYNDIMNTQTWQNDKPHVIYGFAAVDEGQTLTIPAGTNVHLHKGSVLWVYKSSLQIQGVYGNPVIFCGDRLESFYDDVAGQYYGIYFQEALPSKINYCSIKNGTAGIHLYSEDPSNTGYTLELTNTEITNCASYGLFLFTDSLKENPSVHAENIILAKNGFHSFFVLGGGDFNINHSHILGYAKSGQNPTFGIRNHYTDPEGNTWVSNVDEGTITNCVIYGDLDQELAFDTINPNGTTTLNFDFQFNMLLSDPVLTEPIFSNNYWNEEPLFMSIADGDFFYYSNSPLNNAGSNSFVNTITEAVGIGINGVPRSTPNPNIGAYERE